MNFLKFLYSVTDYLIYSEKERIDRTLAICDKHDIRVIRSWAFIDEEEKAGYITQKFENGKVNYLFNIVSLLHK